MKTFETELAKREEELRKELQKIEVYNRMREQLVRDMQWDTMKGREADDEHDDYWYEAPKEDDYGYDKYCVYLELIDAFDKLVIKNK